MAVAFWAGSLLGWERELSRLKDRVARVLGRRESRESSGAFLDGLLSGIERKTGWLMAERAGAERPYRMQSPVGRGRWDAEALRDEVRAYAMEALADADGVLIVDETGFLKKGTHSAGVARQYSGTAGRIENCQIGVFLSHASRWGHALIDRRLYLPQVWAENGARRAKAAIPATTAFATKPEIARDLIAFALDAGVPCAFVLGDAPYGSDRRVRRMLEARRQPYVLAVRSNEPMRVGGGSLEATTSGLLADALPSDAWACHAAGEGAKGPRLHDWARVRLFWSGDPHRERWLLVRRSRKAPNERAYYVVFAPAGATLAELADVAG
jgi:SRSO17 transposase